MKNVKMIFSVLLCVMTQTLYGQSFYDFDVDGDGQLDPEKYRAAYDLYDHGEKIAQTVIIFSEASFTDLDTDKDGVIKEDEWLELSEEPEKNLLEEEDFAVFDADRDGRINQQEWNKDFDPESFGDFDWNKDGFLDDNEFMAGMFDRWDGNGDEVLHPEEFNTSHGELWD